MSSDFKYNFCFVVEEIFELGNTTKSRCLGVRVETQANGKEVWINKRPTSDRRCSDWQRILSDDEALTDSYSIISHEDRIVPNTIRKYLRTWQKYGYSCQAAVATKTIMTLAVSKMRLKGISNFLRAWTKLYDWCYSPPSFVTYVLVWSIIISLGSVYTSSYWSKILLVLLGLWKVTEQVKLKKQIESMSDLNAVENEQACGFLAWSQTHTHIVILPYVNVAFVLIFINHHPARKLRYTQLSQWPCKLTSILH